MTDIEQKEVKKVLRNPGYFSLGYILNNPSLKQYNDCTHVK